MFLRLFKITSVLFALVFSIVVSANELAKVPSNFLIEQWARPTAHSANSNVPDKFGALPAPCSFSHLKFDDPIRKPGQSGQSVLHTFFGNTEANANSSYQSLRSSGDGTCFGGPVNRSAIYLPTMMNAQGKAVLPDFMEVIYRGQAETKSFPRGLKMIFGYDADNPQTWDANESSWAWSFGSMGSFQPAERYGNPNRFEKLEINSYPSWVFKDEKFINGYNMALRLIAPDCWDGQNLDSANHRSHLAYASDNGDGKRTCPSSHPVMIPRMIMIIYYAFNNKSEVEGWYLSSDKANGKNLAAGTNAYAAMIPAWDDDVMNSWVTLILNKLKYGSQGKIGNKKILVQPETSKSFGPTSYISNGYFLYTLETKSGSKGANHTSLNNIMDPPPK